MNKRGTKHIDVMLVSPNVLPCIEQAFHVVYDEITFSDHRATIMDLDATLLFGKSIDKMQNRKSRHLAIGILRKVEVYIECLLREFKEHKITE